MRAPDADRFGHLNVLATGLRLQLSRSALQRSRVLFLTGKAIVRSPAPVLAIGFPSVTQIRKRLSGAPGVSADKFGHPARRVVDSIIVANVVIFALQIWTKGRLVRWGVKDNAAIAAGQWWRFITPAVLHSGWWHLGMNTYSLTSIGPSLERISGRPRFFAVYAAGAVGGCYLSYLRSPAYSLGASGAIFGLVGAILVYVLRQRGRQISKSVADGFLRELGQVLTINFILGLYPGIDNWGHLGGLLAGMGAASILGPS